MDDAKLRYRIPSQSLILIVVGLVFLGISVGLLAHPPIGGKILGGVLATLSLVFIYRSARLGVQIDGSGVTSRGLEWTRRIPWCEVSEVTTGSAKGSSPVPTSTVILVL